MMLISLIISFLLSLYILYSFNKKHSFQFISSESSKNFSGKVHVVLSLNNDSINNVKWLLKQNEKIDKIYVTIPSTIIYKNGVYIEVSYKVPDFIKKNCILQVSSGYSMLSKEQNANTIILFLKDNKKILYIDLVYKALLFNNSDIFLKINTNDTWNLIITDLYK